MKFRKRLFWGLAVLVLLYVVGTVLLVDNGETVQECVDGGASVELCNAAADVGTGIGVTILLCVGGLLFVVFALLAWRNGVGLETERRHQEQLAAARDGREG